MIYWAPLLHIYQPPTQEAEVLKRINRECYVPVFDMLERNQFSKISLNINGVLIDLLKEFGLTDTIDKLIRLVKNGIIEIVGTAKYHPLLPLIQDSEINRQIKLNEELNSQIFGDNWSRKGFFPPEMAISSKVLKIIAERGYKWAIASGIACPNSWPINEIHRTKEGLRMFFRDDVISNEISFKKISPKGFIEKITKLFNGINGDNGNNGSTKSECSKYVITAMDGETFGHHIQNYETTFLEKALQLANNAPNIKNVFISELLDLFPSKEIIEPKSSSWSTDKGDLDNNIPYPLWKHPNNPVHKIQYRMLKSIDKLINLCDSNNSYTESNNEFKIKYETARYFYDKGLYSCPMWWASMRPSWSPGLIYKGADLLLLAALNAQLALIYIKNTEGEEIFDGFIDYHHRLLAELTKQTSNLLNLRTF